MIWIGPSRRWIDYGLRAVAWFIIDLGDYGFPEHGMHALTLLTISEPIYKRMSSDSGLPNRGGLGFYVAKMRKFGYQAEFLVPSVMPTGRLEPAGEYVSGTMNVDAGCTRVDEIRHRLADEFKNLDDEEFH
jgi:hypothetical protein